MLEGGWCAGGLFLQGGCGASHRGGLGGSRELVSALIAEGIAEGSVCWHLLSAIRTEAVCRRSCRFQVVTAVFTEEGAVRDFLAALVTVLHSLRTTL